MTTFNDKEFQLVVESLLNDEINEGLYDKFKTQIDFIKGIAANLKANFKDLLKMFKNKNVVNFFKGIKWSFSVLFKILKTGFKAYKTLSDTIFEYLSNNKIAKWTQDKLQGLDDYLQSHPKTKRLAGIAVSAILVYIWLNMSFTGDFEYDFNFTDVIEALAGNFTISTIFAGPEGLKLLALFATGFLFGLSFPWVGSTSVQMIGGVITALNKKFHLVKMKIRESMIREAISNVSIKNLKKMVNEEPTFIFVMGGTGSGKNYVSSKFLGGVKLVDTDKYIEEYAIEYGTDGRKQISRAVARSKRELLTSFKKKESVVQVGTGLNNKSSANKFKWAKEAGMKVVVVLVDTDIKTAMKRNHDRAASGKQALVPDEKVERSISMGKGNLELYSNDPNVDSAIYYKN